MADKPLGGLAGWLLNKVRSRTSHAPELRVLERVALAPRQSLVLVETEGRRLLVATSADSAPAFFPLDACGPAGNREVSPRASWQSSPRSRRASW